MSMPICGAFTTTQSFDHMASDLPRDFRTIAETKGKSAAALALSGVVVKTLLAAFLLNRIDEELYGGTPAPFDLLGLSSNFIASGEGLSTNRYLSTMIDNGWEQLTGERLFDTDPLDPDRAFDWASAWEDLQYNAANDIPLVRNAAALLGWGDETLPLPGVSGSVSTFFDSVKGLVGDDGETTAEQMLMATAGLLSDFVLGGRQLNKTLQGASTALQGGRFYGFGDNKRLQYPMDNDAWGPLQAALFGNTGLNETRDFYANDWSGLSAKQTNVWRDLVEGGAGRTEVYEAIQQIRYAETEGDSTETVARKKRDILAAAELTDEEKSKLYSGIISDSRDDDFAQMMQEGLTWADITDSYNEYASINAQSGVTATKKATAFAKWVDDQPYTAEQKKLIKDEFAYYSIVPAEAERYAKLTDAGLSSAQAYDLTEILSQLQPLAGKDSVSDHQRYEAIVESNLSQANKIAAMGTVMGTEMTTESGNPTQYAKLLSALDYGMSLDEYLEVRPTTALDRYLKFSEAGAGSSGALSMAQAIAALEPEDGKETVSNLQRYTAAVSADATERDQMAALSSMMQETEYFRVETSYDYGISPAQFVGVKKKIAELDEIGRAHV